MYKSPSSSFFLGCSSPTGFYSLFSELHVPEDGWKLYIIKGGPGTGKSTLMKKVAAEAAKRGLYHERIYCSSDPDSLDGVIIPSLKVSIADGTSPHVLEPDYPGVSEITVDMGRFRDDNKLTERRDEIIKITKENRLQHKKCTDFLSAAKSVYNDTSNIVLSALKIERLHRFSEKLASAKLTARLDTQGKIKKRFLSALTPKGFTVFRDTFSDMCENIFVLDDPFSHASSVMLKILSMKAREQGLDCILCYCPMSPEYKPEHLIIPELSLGFFTSNRYHPDDFPSAAHINCKRFFDADILSRHKNRIAFNNRSGDELLNEAVKKLEKAKSIHDILEKYYIDAMDFSAAAEYGEEIIEKIFADKS
ncbi:MAG: hypothetical protein E7573_09280 [Ruminococcaceae bacterium]|nr:hypothetical protein [Oscillospiraceae bacterium]MBR3596391.1 hypothetical protein [Clostridia bacterium]